MSTNDGASPLGRAVRLLSKTEKPIVLVGPRAHHAVLLVKELARILGAPILTTPDAKSLIDETEPASAGVFSFGATAYASSVVSSCDAVLAIGTSLGEFASRSGNAFTHAAILHVTDDAADPTADGLAKTQLVGDIAATLSALLHLVGFPMNEPWYSPPPRTSLGDESVSPSEAAGMSPVDAMRALGEALPPRARLACDVTSAALHVLRELRLGPDRRLWLQLERSACMGSALSSGLGVRLASGLPTLVVIGDWGYLMGSSELHTAASMGVDRFVVVVWSNSGGALIRAGVRAQNLPVPASTHTWKSPQFAKMAEALGMRALTARTAKGLERAAAVAMRAPFPVLIDAIIDPDSVIPGASARYLHLDASGRPS